MLRITVGYISPENRYNVGNDIPQPSIPIAPRDTSVTETSFDPAERNSNEI